MASVNFFNNFLTKQEHIIESSFSRTGAILWDQTSPDWGDIPKPIFKKKFAVFLFDTLWDRDGYVEVEIDPGTRPDP